MFSLETLKIDLKSLNDSPLELNWELCDDYFEALEDAEIRSGKVAVCVSLQKTADSYALSIKTEGFVIVTCDRCLELKTAKTMKSLSWTRTKEYSTSHGSSMNQ